MIIIDYHPVSGAAIPDGKFMSRISKIIGDNALFKKPRNKDYYFRVSTLLFVAYFYDYIIDNVSKEEYSSFCFRHEGRPTRKKTSKELISSSSPLFLMIQPYIKKRSFSSSNKFGLKKSVFSNSNISLETF